MSYAILADLVVVLHFAFVLFVVMGGAWVVFRPRVAWLHVPAFLWGAGIELVGGICPLTPLEQWLRAQAGDAAYAGGFVEHYLLGILYPQGLDRRTQVVLGVLVLVINLGWYTLAWRRTRRHTRT